MPEETRADETPSREDVDPKVIEVYRILKRDKSASKRNDWLERRRKAWDAIENDMASDKEKAEAVEQGMEYLVVNKCVKGVQGASAIVTDQKPEIKFFPAGSGDLYVAELLKRGHDFVWAKNEGSDVTYDGVEECKVSGLAFFDAYHDKNKGIYGRIIFEETPPDDIYFDVNSRKRDFSDTHMIKAKLRSKEYINEHYPEVADDDIVYEGDFDKEPTKSEGVTGKDDYQEVEAGRIKGDGTDEPKEVKHVRNIWEIEAWLLKTKKEDWEITKDADGNPTAKRMMLPPGEKYTGEGRHWPRMREVRVQRIIVGRVLISETENPHGEDADGNPVMSLIGLKHQRTRSAYPMSPVNYALPLNQDMNKRRMQFALNISHNVNSPIVESGDSCKWEGTPGTPGSRVKVGINAAFPVTRLPSGSFQASHFLELSQIDQQDIDDIFDTPDVMKGRIPPGQENMAGRLAIALQDTAGVMSKPFLRALESTLVRLARVNVSIMLREWPRAMWERLIEPDEWKNWKPKDVAEAADEEEITPEVQAKITEKWQRALEMLRPKDPAKEPQISLLDLDVRITAGSSLPTNRMARAQIALEMKREGVYDAEAVLDASDDPAKDKIIPRIKKMEQQMMQAAAMKGKR